MLHRTVLQYAIAVAIGILIGLVVNSWRYGADIADLKAAHALELRSIAEAHSRQLEEALAKQQEAEARVAAIDAQRTKELTDALSENDRLRDAVADSERRLRIKATCPADTAGSVPGSDTAAGVADAGTVELSRETEQLVFNLRADLLRDRAMIRGLQDYVRQVCLH